MVKLIPKLAGVKSSKYFQNLALLFSTNLTDIIAKFLVSKYLQLANPYLTPWLISQLAGVKSVEYFQMICLTLFHKQQ